MSEVMKALQQSEQGYQAQMTPSYHAAPYQVKPSKNMRWWWVVLCIVIPIILMLLALAIQGYNMMPVQEKPAQHVVSDNEPKATADELQATARVKRLPYPEFDSLKPLPKPVFQPKPVPVNTKPSKVVEKTSSETQPASSEGRRIETDHVKLSQSENQDWNVDNLDLSGLSPELALRFQSALDSPSESNKPKPSSSSQVSNQSKNVINLVGNESDYRGRLPKMNFQTHMYSSKSQGRWIKVNGSDIHEGEWIIQPLVKLDKILPGSLIVTFDNHQLQIPALYEWAG